MAEDLFRSDACGTILVAGGGACGYRDRWFPDPPKQAGGVPGPGGVLVGDGAFAAVLRRDEGPLRVDAVCCHVDPGLADIARLDGSDYRFDPERFRVWLYEVAPGLCSRMIAAALITARVPRDQPLFFVGTNSGRQVKTELCRAYARGSGDERLERAAQLQVAAIREHGHLFGGDAVANLRLLCDAGLLRAGDRILGLEAGDAYYYGAFVLSVM